GAQPRGYPPGEITPTVSRHVRSPALLAIRSGTLEVPAWPASASALPDPSTGRTHEAPRRAGVRAGTTPRSRPQRTAATGPPSAKGSLLARPPSCPPPPPCPPIPPPPP